MSASVVIPAKNGADTIGACLDAVLSQDYDGDVDILVIDSGSTDGTVEEVLARPRARLHHILPEAFDHGDTRNLGAGMTSGDAIVFLVQDAEPADGQWLSALVANLERDAAVAGAFSRILPRPDASPLTTRSCESDLCFGTQRIEVRQESAEEWAALDPLSLRLRSNFNDVSSVIRRSVWERLPLERGTFGEDIKFARSAIEAGHKIVFEPASCVFHSHEYGPVSIYKRTRIDAELNLRHLGRMNVDRFRHALVLARRAVREDLAFLRHSARPLAERWASLVRSPAYRFAESLGFWRGVKVAIRDGCRPWVRAPAARPTPDRPLKVLMVVHGFPPESWAGVEVVSLTLARALRRRGHEVVLFVRTPGTEQEEDHSLHVGEFDGFRVHRFVNRLLFFGIVEPTYRLRPAEDAFDRVVEQERPDVVHIQHMIHLSTGIIDRCRAHGLPSVVTLSDFWVRCSKVQLIRPDRKNCTIPPPGLGCAMCVMDKPGLVDPLATVDRLLGSLPRRWAAGVPQTIPAPPPGRKLNRENAASLLRRETWMRNVLLRADRLVVASRTLKQSVAGLGVPPERICLSAYGMDTTWLAGGPPERTVREPGSPPRVGFIGSLVWYKGLEVLAEAVAGMPVGSAQIHVHGDHEGGADPAARQAAAGVVARARALAGDRITFHGSFPHDAVGEIHASLDVLVVPSIWQEAYGLTVREAHLAGTPVVGSDIAGIAEGVEHDVDGLLFPTGDATALRAALQRFVDEPELGPRLAAGARPIKTDDEEAAEAEWRYRQVIGKSVAVT